MFRAGSEVLPLETVNSFMESNLSETRCLSCKRQYSEREEGCVQSWPGETSRQCPFLAERGGRIEHSACCGPQAGSEMETVNEGKVWLRPG